MPKAILLDTETDKLEGNPIQIAFTSVEFTNTAMHFDFDHMHNQLYSLDDNNAIDYGAMAVHHILPDDLLGKPHFSTFRLPPVLYVIGHNVDYDLRAISKCGADISNIKAICTLALARMVWPDATSHKLGALAYMLSYDPYKMRAHLQNAHDAAVDVKITSWVLRHICDALGIKSTEQLYSFSELARVPTVMYFGKHKGMAIADLPDDYVKWLLKQPDLDPYLRMAVSK